MMRTALLLLIIFASTPLKAFAQGGPVQLTNLAGVYSPDMITQTEKNGSSQQYLYFGGEDRESTDHTSADRVYRAKCSTPFSCESYQVVLDSYQWKFNHINDPRIVKLSQTGKPDYYIMYMTVANSGNPEVSATEQQNGIYYSVSWADDGFNWSVPHPLLKDVWIPAAATVNGEVYVYGISNASDPSLPFMVRYDMGTSGLDQVGAPQAVNIFDGDGAPCITPAEGGQKYCGYLYTQVSYQPKLGYYYILGQNAMSTGIDLLVSWDGINWYLQVQNIAAKAPGVNQIMSPAANPTSICWLYYSNSVYDLSEPEGTGYTLIPQVYDQKNVKFARGNIYVSNWCNGDIPSQYVTHPLEPDPTISPNE